MLYDKMRKFILIIILLLVASTAMSEETEMTFWIYGVDKRITQKYEGLFEVPRFGYMGGVFGDYVYVVTLIITISGNDYYCVGIVSDHWFDKAVEDGGYMTPTVYNKRQVYLSYRSVILIEIPFEAK